MIKTKSFQRVLTCALSLVMALTCVCVPAFAADDMTEPNPSIEQHPDDTMNPTKVVTVIGEKAFYKVENGVVIYADRDDGSGWEAVPSAYIKGSEYNEGDIDFGMYVVGADEVRFVALDECHDEGDGTFTFYHGTKDSATVSEDVDTATNDDPSMGTQFYINIEDGIDPDGPSKEEVVNPGTDDARVEYEVTVSTKTNYQLNATVPMYVCMYGFRGTGSVVTPSKDAYQLKNYSTINENSKATIVDITKLTHYARIYDENHSDENLYAIAYDAGTYTYWYSNPGDEELAKHEAHLVLTDRNINASGEVYVIFIDNEWDFKAAGVLTGDCLRETVNAIDPNHPLSEDLVYGEFNFGKEFAVGAAVEGGEDKGLAIKVTGLQAQPATWKLVPLSTAASEMKRGELAMSLAPESAISNIDTFLAENGYDGMDDYLSAAKETVEGNVTRTLILQAVAEKEGIEAQESDFQAYFGSGRTVAAENYGKGYTAQLALEYSVGRLLQENVVLN
jgi:hypothetical protein